MTSPDLPAELKAALDSKLRGFSRTDAAGRSAVISKTYRDGGGSGTIRSETDALAYALARMPAAAPRKKNSSSRNGVVPNHRSNSQPIPAPTNSAETSSTPIRKAKPDIVVGICLPGAATGSCSRVACLRRFRRAVKSESGGGVESLTLARVSAAERPQTGMRPGPPFRAAPERPDLTNGSHGCQGGSARV